MVVEREVGIALQSEDGQMDGVAKDYVTYSPVAESLDIMDNTVDTPPVQLGENILGTASYGVGVGIVAVLLGKRAAWVRHGELALCFIKDHPGPVVFNKRIKPSGEHRGHADIGNAKQVSGIGFPASSLSQQLSQAVLVLHMVSIEIRCRDQPVMVLQAADQAVFPGELVEFKGKLPGPLEFLPHLLRFGQSRAQRLRQIIQRLLHKVDVGLLGISKRQDIYPLEPEHFHEHDGIGAIAGGDAEHVLYVMLHTYAVDAFDPGAAVLGEASPLRYIHQPLSLDAADEQVVEVNRLIARR